MNIFFLYKVAPIFILILKYGILGSKG